MIRQHRRSPLFPSPPLSRSSFADQHGVLRGKTLAASEVPAALERGVTLTSTLLLKDTSHRTVFPAFTPGGGEVSLRRDRKSTRLNSSHLVISYAVFCLKKKT